MNAMVSMKRIARAYIGAVLLPLLACTTTADPVRHRAVRSVANAEWARGSVFYEIFVRSFYDSNGDGIGDFNGLTSKLDYVGDLGANAIWLMPVFESPSYHGYDTTDYETIERDYGSNADFQHFLDEAHKRGMRVIVDFVMNHTSSDHPWFIDSASSTASLKRNWYVWNATNPGWTQPWGGNFPTWYLKNGAYYYAVFWSGMPDLNYRTPEVKAEMFRLGRLWLSRGVDGFRLDATRYLIETGPGAGQADTPETHQMLKDFASDVARTKADAYVVAENTVDTQKLATYFDDGLSNFNFPLASAILDSVNSGNGDRVRSTLRDMTAAYPSGVIDAPFLTNHDHVRIATQLGNDGGKLRDAAAILLTLPGAPFIYYGEEVGLQNGPGSEDEWKRTPMPWTSSGGFSTATPWHAYAPGLASSNVAVESGDARSLLSYYRNWIAARKRSNALLKGDIKPIDSPAQVLAFIRDSGDERVLAAHNLGATAATLPATGTLEAIIEDDGVSSAGGIIVLPAHSSGAWRVR